MATLAGVAHKSISWRPAYGGRANDLVASATLAVGSAGGGCRYPVSQSARSGTIFQVSSLNRVVILLSGGAGSRFGADTPKQMVMLAGRPVLAHTVANLRSYEEAEAIVVVAHPDTLADVKQIIADEGDQRFRVVAGGANRLESTRAGLEAIDSDDDTMVLIHDAVRPFLPHRVLDDCWARLENFDAIDTIIPSVDTVVRVTKDASQLDEIPDRRRYWRGQTPQGFRLGPIREAYDLLGDLQHAPFTDDCGVFIYSFPEASVGAVEGAEENMKITYPADLTLAEQMIKAGVGTSFRSRRRAPIDLSTATVVVFGGTSGLGKDIVDELSRRGASVFAAGRSTGVDVGDAKSVQNYLDQVAKETGKIDVVVNSAGVLNIGRLDETDDDEAISSVMTNYVGAVNVAKYSFKYLAESEGHLVLFASSSYYRGRRDYAIYSSTKAAVVNLTQALAEEWSSDGVQISCIVPRRANTSMRHNAFPGEDPASLLQPEIVTEEFLRVLSSEYSGLIVHVY